MGYRGRQPGRPAGSERGRVGTDEADIPAREFASIGGAVLLATSKSAGEISDADDLAIRAPGRVQYHPAEPRADVDERGALRAESGTASRRRSMSATGVGS